LTSGVEVKVMVVMKWVRMDELYHL
jgi:hypothetical protein